MFTLQKRKKKLAFVRICEFIINKHSAQHYFNCFIFSETYILCNTEKVSEIQHFKMSEKSLNLHFNSVKVLLTSISSWLVDADVIASAVVLFALVDVDARRYILQLIARRADAGRNAVDDVALVIATVVRRAKDR